MESSPQPILDLRNLSKKFGGQTALDEVSLDVRRGEVHALLGQNGSGKSTLIKILAGYHQADTGEAVLNGKPLELGSATAAAEGGIRFIHQDLGLVEDMDCVDNLALGSSYAGTWWLSDRKERRATSKTLAEYGVDVDVARPIRTLPAAQQAMVAIIRALHSGVGQDSLLVLDEPTAALPDREVHQLFDLITRLREAGSSVLYVTHRLGEVFQIAERVTILRDGARIATRSVSELSHDSLVELIIGRPLEAFYPAPPVSRKDLALRVEDIRGDLVERASLDVHKGEIVGVTGLVGSGYERLLSLIFGGSRPKGGRVSIGDTDVELGSPSASVAAGLGFAPADRKRLAGFPLWSLRENITLPRIPARGRARWLSESFERTDVHGWLPRLRVVPADPERLFSTLSGGNQQKVILTRWLRNGARAFLLEEPTNGIDMEAKHIVYQALSDVAGTGTGILMSSSDTEELAAVCDRVLVMRQGEICADLAGDSLTVERIIGESIRVGASPSPGRSVQDVR